MQEYIRAVVEPIISAPERLQVQETNDERGTLLTLTVSKGDMGRLIGRAGETIKCVRTLMHAYGSLHEKKISIKVNEP